MFRYRFASTLVLLASTTLAATAAAQTTAQPPARLPATRIVADSAKAVTVQNDRHSAVTLFLDAGRVDREIGTVPAGATATLELPTWATQGRRELKVVARAEGESRVIATYAVPVVDGRQLGLLVPPSEGLPRGDSLMIALPVGTGSAATVTVDNIRDRAVSVYAEQGLIFVKLGDVAARQLVTLPVPASITRNKQPVRVFARPTGAAQVSTKALPLKDGDHIAVIIME